MGLKNLETKMQGRNVKVIIAVRDIVSNVEKLEEMLSDYFGKKRIHKVKDDILELMEKNQFEKSIMVKDVETNMLYQVSFEKDIPKLKKYSTDTYIAPLKEYLSKQPEMVEAQYITELIQDLEGIIKSGVSAFENGDTDEEIAIPEWTPKGFFYKEGCLEEGYIVADADGNEFIYCPPLDKYVSRYFISTVPCKNKSQSKPDLKIWTNINYNDASVQAASIGGELFSAEEYKIWWDWLGKPKGDMENQKITSEILMQVIGIKDYKNFPFPEEVQKTYCWTTSKSKDSQIIMIEDMEELALPNYYGEEVGFRVIISKT